MKTSTRLLVIAFICLIQQSLHGQQMLNPQDSVINYNPAAPPVQPAFGKIGKWVRTPRVSWNTTAYKCYIYKGCDFRLHFPQTYQPGDGKKYPIFVFYHGNGEEAPIYDNEYQLRNGGLIFHNAEVNGLFDGYIIMMQNQADWTLPQYVAIHDLIDTLVQEYGGDAYRVVMNGLSGGGQAIINELQLDPSCFAGAIPMSAALPPYANPTNVNIQKFTPIWNLDGGLDNDPTPAQALFVDSTFHAAGGNYVYKNYPTLGHDTWDSTWLEPNFWPFVNNAYLSNPWPLYGKTVFCPGQSINVTIGIVPGLAGYQWRMNGAVISGATTDSLIVTQAGTYDARVLRGPTWSDWSHIPVQILNQTPAPIDSIAQPNCTISKGVITITSPKSSGLTYSIDGTHYQTSATFANLSAGTYPITVKNGTTCTSTATTAIVNPQPVTPAQPGVTITQPSCTVPKATIFLTSSDTGIVYTLNDGKTYGPTHQFYGLPAGTYWPRVKNGAGCTSAFMISTVNPAPAVPAAPALTVTQPTCTVGTGAIAITAPTGTNFLYSIDTVTWQPGTSFGSLAPKNYPVLVKDTDGCISHASVATILAALSAPAAPQLAVVQPTCSISTGSIDITAPTGAGLMYSINGEPYQANNNFINLPPNSYSVNVENSAGCVSSPATTVILPAPSAPGTPQVSVMQPTCTVPTGAINVIASSDTLFLYSINGQTYQASSNFGGLTAKSYSVTLKNSAGCISSQVAAVIQPQPATPSVPAISIMQPTCTVATGVIDIMPETVPGLVYSVTGTNYQPDTSFGNLTPGTYAVTAQDSAGCVSLAQAAVILPAAGAPSTPAVDILQPTCALPTGTIIISPTDTGLLYSINGANYQSDTTINKLAPGAYQITAKNSQGCISASGSAVVLGEPASCNTIINIYPNPYGGEVFFNITAQESGKGQLVFYNLLGQQMNTVIESDFKAGTLTTITCPMGFAHRQAVVYVFTIGKTKVRGTLLPQKF